ncbi:MAG: DNA repair protein RecO [Bacteroidales bacterium]|jgi:DNA repair protein RecO (recombination protein O)
MYLTTRGIVFRQTRYSDTSLVVSIFTEQLGLRPYIVKGVRGPKAKTKAVLFQPLTLLNMVVDQQDRRNLNYIREANLAYHYQSIHKDIRKSSILFFLNELMTKSIQEESVNPEMFRYIFEHLVLLDCTPDIPGHYHLAFALHLTRFLGFFPQGTYLDARSIFDLEEGSFNTKKPLHDNYVSENNCSYFNELIRTVPGNFTGIVLPPAVRDDLLSKILRYYHLHLPLQGEFKSPAILHEVLHK